jgi:excisionase family DNA binding protein
MELTGAMRRDAFFTYAEIAALLKVPLATVRYWGYLRRIQGVRFGKLVRIPRSEMIRFLEGQQLGLSAELEQMVPGGMEQKANTASRCSRCAKKAPVVVLSDLDNSGPSLIDRGAEGRKEAENA